MNTNPPVPPQLSALGMFDRGFEGSGVGRDEPNPFVASLRNSVFGDLLFRDPRKSEYGKVFAREDVTARAKAAYVAGRVAHDIINDGSRTPYWLLNHPLGVTALLSNWANNAAGINPDRQAIAAELTGRGTEPTQIGIEKAHNERMGFTGHGEIRGMPLGLAKGVIPVLAGATLVQASGNHDMARLAQGARPAGYASILPTETDDKESRNALAELALRYVTGRTGRLLPWEEFTAERPDISPEDYSAARIHQFDKGLLGLGLAKGTGRNLEGEPEFTMMGFRVPLSGAASTLGGLAGSVAGAQLAAKMVEAEATRRAAAGVEEAKRLPIGRGNARLLGAAGGMLAGGVMGNLASRAVNEAVIQPTFYPEREALQDSWPQRRLLEIFRPPAPLPEDDDDVQFQQPRLPVA